MTHLITTDNRVISKAATGTVLGVTTWPDRPTAEAFARRMADSIGGTVEVERP